MYKKIFAIVAFFSLCTMNAQEMTFSQKVGKLMELVTAENVDNNQVREILKTLAIAPKEMKEGAMDYSIYDDFEGDTLYYIPYKTADEPRYSVEKLKQGDKLFYTLQFLISSEYTKDPSGKVTYKDKDYLYNTTIEDLMLYCTTPMSYKNGKGNNPESPLLSCVYTNPNSKRKLMYWVVCENKIGDKEKNRVKEIKIQSQELWR
ncbi:hypothetical protein HX071_13815 [Myroides marinus]|uniref:hypothetical protein n=1 Tax=Myroides marinus TaxID=703342 RepID=UPI0007424703|nr:hypothetical protein [Myroides marinus]KUF43094.1 hypothetical protein AS361_00155 [Myroides marinus]MDM1353607.1 hypothetical protein [Myroides marinus]MDM1363163.1 hypothetical protein [Myroides marinus]MDM1376432.1 hypothetical protein [Myroides marinus]MDM1503265.1 hypothetical protein [Myroides marinus]